MLLKHNTQEPFNFHLKSKKILTISVNHYESFYFLAMFILLTLYGRESGMTEGKHHKDTSQLGTGCMVVHGFHFRKTYRKGFSTN